MQEHDVVLRADDPRRDELEAQGWSIAATSWAAQLTAPAADVDRLRTLVDRMRGYGELREVREDDIAAVLALDAVTVEDYPGSIATRHVPLTPERARVSRERRGFGVFDSRGRALAVTYVDVNDLRAETDFTVVDREHRGRGLGSAVKAASVLALIEDGVEIFRTG
ncbi:acetyltransferase, partial [Agromyces sp. SYSU K20354]|uniref:acetyltransferase n=1 Tax=Agromyces cavernae TaxID=2898659 RepID=UPI001E34DCA1